MEAEILVGTVYYNSKSGVLLRDFYQLFIDEEYVYGFMGYEILNEKIIEIGQRIAKKMSERGIKKVDYRIINGKNLFDPVGDVIRLEELSQERIKKLEEIILRGC